MSLITVTPSAYSYPLLIKNLLNSPKVCSREQEIVYGEKVRMTYADFFERLNRLANVLEELGIKQGSTVAVMDWDSHRYLEHFFAVPMLGAVLQTVNVRLSTDQIVYTLNHAQADIVMVNTDFLPIIKEIAPKLTTVKKFVLLQDDEYSGELPVKVEGEYEALLAAAQTEYDFPDFDENTRATTFYTTGTTGLPKGVYFSHRQLVLHTLAAGFTFGIHPKQGGFHVDDAYMPITPMFHVHAWGIPYVATVMGVKQVYPGRYEPEKLLRLKQKENITFSHCVPTILHMLLTNPLAKDIDLQGWKIIIGGSSLSKGLAMAAQERGIDVFSAYGMSETCPVLTTSHIPPLEDYSNTQEVDLRCYTGRPIPLVDFRIVDNEMQDIAHDGIQTGEVVVRAPWLTQGYLHDPKQSEDLWIGGYLHTQDIAHMDEKGWVKITDRIKDVIKTGGEWISSVELENILSLCPGVAEVAVIGKPDPKWGERPLGIIVKKPDADLTVESIKAYLMKAYEEGNIPKYAVIENIEFVSELIKTSVGKLNKKEMRKKWSS